MQFHIKIVTVGTMILATTLFGLTQSFTSATAYPDSPVSETTDELPGIEQRATSGLIDEADTIISGMGGPESVTIAEQEALANIFTRSIDDTNITDFWKWNPGQDKTKFWLKDPLIEGGKSVVVANTINFRNSDDPICGVVFVGYGWFKLECIKPPAENTELRYTTITSEPLPPPELASQDRASDEIKENLENVTSQTSESNNTSVWTNNMTSR